MKGYNFISFNLDNNIIIFEDSSEKKEGTMYNTNTETLEKSQYSLNEYDYFIFFHQGFEQDN